MFGRKKRSASQVEASGTVEPQARQHDAGAASADARLPGSAGYPVGRLPKKKNHMPPMRFTFQRPDGKPD
jgi:hypothetical protein